MCLWSGRPTPASTLQEDSTEGIREQLARLPQASGLPGSAVSLIREIVPTLPERPPSPSHHPILGTLFHHSWTPAQLPCCSQAPRLSPGSFSTCQPQPSFHSHLHHSKPSRKLSHPSHQACHPWPCTALIRLISCLPSLSSRSGSIDHVSRWASTPLLARSLCP